MVASPGASGRPRALQSLNEPVPVEVRSDDSGRPLAVRLHKRWSAVAELRDTWRLDEAWWRQHPISRIYSTVLLEDGLRLTLFQDLLTHHWYRQRYA